MESLDYTLNQSLSFIEKEKISDLKNKLINLQAFVLKNLGEENKEKWGDLRSLYRTNESSINKRFSLPSCILTIPGVSSSKPVYLDQLWWSKFKEKSSSPEEANNFIDLCSKEVNGMTLMLEKLYSIKRTINSEFS